MKQARLRDLIWRFTVKRLTSKASKNWPRRMRAMNDSTYDVAVVGAGVFGAWTAYQLQQSGRRVMLIDAFGAGNSRSSSGDESRIIRMGYGADEIYTRSALLSLQLWKEFFARINQPLFYQTGVLWLAHEDDLYPVKTAETLEKIGIPFEKLTTSEVGRRYPQIGLERISWAMLEPQSGVLVARRAVQAVVSEAIKNGVEYLQGAVKAPAPDGSGSLNGITTMSGRRISAGSFVFACGSWLPKIFPDLLADRIHPTRQEVFFFGTPAGDQSFTSTALPIWIDFKD